ncbi:alpha/beta hydrolase [Clostridium sp.]|jgi:lysophospholipase|uniref:alpha/beta hydrolase n=1 Tax=Clostridium sp. TaxID=1506 RepID=UPI00284B30FB|nr:alpha/beta hydrolase [Clostridium sp.]MDR3594516.1 alpha/beta hydrolase [Clostridium sp.]
MNKDSFVLEKFANTNCDISNKRMYISQNNYREEMLNKVEPYLKEKLKYGYIVGENHVKIYYEKFIVENSKASIVISHGLGEFTEKYYELIYYFIKENYSVFILEHRGHGRSERLGLDDSQVNVEMFEYYIQDFKKFIDKIVIPNSNNKSLLLFAHSMGGAIATAFLEKYNNYFKAAVLSSPMHGMNTGKAPKILAGIVSMTMKLCGNEIKYMPGQVPYNRKKFFPSKSTSCKERYEYLYEKIKKNKEYHNGGPSVLWYLESLKATKRLIKRKNASKVTIPILLFQAEHDNHVIPKAQVKFASYAKNCTLIHVKGSMHGTYFEKDDISFYIFDKVLYFYESNIKGSSKK